MILRRITEHVKAQNWTAVALDFVIVVVGVFMGIQVANWDAARQGRVLGQEYIVRLHDEVELAEARHNSILRELNFSVQYLQEAIDVVTGSDAEPSLSQNQCDAAFSSHIYRASQLSIPTLEELLANGRISTLSDHALRAAILKLAQLQNATQANREVFQGDDIPSLSIVFPEMITLNPRVEYTRYGSGPLGGQRCDAALMRQSRAFTNSLIDNMYRMELFITLTYSPEGEQLGEIHKLLDQRLGLTHERVD